MNSSNGLFFQGADEHVHYAVSVWKASNPIKWNGDVSPCSHLIGEEFKASNVVHESFHAIWERSAVFANLRQELQQIEGKCGSC